MTIGSVVTHGFGSPGSVALVVTRGFSPGVASDSNPYFTAAPSKTLRVDFYSPSGAKLDILPLAGTDILGASYGPAVGRIGMFRLNVAADALSADGLAIARQVWIYREPDELLIFKGIIEELQTKVDANGVNTIEVVGRSTGASLTWSTTLLGRQFDNTTLASTVSTLLTGTQFTAGEIDSPSTNITVRMDGRSIWDALNGVADVFGLSLREDNLSSTIDIGAFGSSSGITLRNLPTHSTSPYMVNIASIKKRAYALDIVNKVILIAQQTGIGGSTVWFNLGDSTRTSPYTIQTDTGPDGQEYQWIEDAASIALYGERSRVIQVRDILPLSTSATDLTRAANTLYDEGVTYLLRHKDPLVAYEVEAIGLTHIDGGAYRFEVGDTFRIQFHGWTQDNDGTSRSWLTVDSDLYLMGFTRTFDASGADKWNLTFSNILREIPNAGNITEKFMQQLQAVKAAPLPYVLFGDNVARFSEDGLDIVSLESDAFASVDGSRKVSWKRTTLDGADVAEIFGYWSDTGSAFDTNSILVRSFKGTEGGAANLGIYNSQDSEDWDILLNLLYEHVGDVLLIRTETQPLGVMALEKIDDDNYRLKVMSGGSLSAVGSMKTANTGQYLIPAGPGSGNAVRSGSAGSYGSWSGLALTDVTAPAAPTATAFASASTTHNVTMPATVAASDMLICVMAFDGNPTLSAAPSGWTNILDVVNGTANKLAVWYKVADGTEDGTSVNFATAGNEEAVAHVYRILAGTYEGVPAISTGATGSSASPNPDAVTPTWAGRFLSISCMSGDGDSSVPTAAPDSGFLGTVSGAGVNGCAVASAYASNNSNTDDPGSFSGGGSSTWVAATIAVMAATATTEALYITGLDVDPASTPAYIQIQLGTGAVGAETAIGTYKLMPDDQTLEFLAAIPVATATRISARIATPDSAANHELTLHVLNQDDVG